MEAAPGLEALMIPLQADDLEKAVLMEAEAPAPALQPAGHSGLDEEEDDERFQDEEDGLEQHTLLWLLLPRRRVVGWLTAAPAFYICHAASIVGAAGWLGVLVSAFGCCCARGGWTQLDARSGLVSLHVGWVGWVPGS